MRPVGALRVVAARKEGPWIYRAASFELPGPKNRDSSTKTQALSEHAPLNYRMDPPCVSSTFSKVCTSTCVMVSNFPETDWRWFTRNLGCPHTNTFMHTSSHRSNVV
jgi:hypothetical protein